jgi:predicted ATPase
MTKLGFGKHGDDDIENVPEDYLKWLMNNSQEKVDICKSELERRASKFDGTFMMRIVKTGFGEVSKGLPESEIKLCERARDALIKAITSAAGSTQP